METWMRCVAWFMSMIFPMVCTNDVDHCECKLCTMRCSRVCTMSANLLPGISVLSMLDSEAMCNLGQSVINPICFHDLELTVPEISGHHKPLVVSA